MFYDSKHLIQVWGNWLYPPPQNVKSLSKRQRFYIMLRVPESNRSLEVMHTTIAFATL